MARPRSAAAKKDDKAPAAPNGEKPPRRRKRRPASTNDEVKKAVGGMKTSAQPSVTSLPIPEVGGGFGGVVETVFGEIPPDQVAPMFEKLRDELEIEDALTPNRIEEELNKADKRALLAHQLYANARYFKEVFDTESTRIMGALRAEATSMLQAEIDAGERTKKITIDDVTAKVADRFSDEYSELTERGIKTRKTVEHLEQLVKRADSRVRSLAAMLGKHNKR